MFSHSFHCRILHKRPFSVVCGDSTLFLCPDGGRCGWLPLVSKCQVWRIIQERFIYFSEQAGIRIKMRPVGDVRCAWNRTGPQSSPSWVPFQAWQTPHCPRPYKSVSQIRNHSHHFSIMVHPTCKTHPLLSPPNISRMFHMLIFSPFRFLWLKSPQWGCLQNLVKGSP